jgi:hypothetical protein
MAQKPIYKKQSFDALIVGNKEHAAHVVYISKAKSNQLEEHCTSKSISKSRLATRKKEEKELIHEERLHTYFAHEDYELRSHNSDKIFRLLVRLHGQLKEKYIDYFVFNIVDCGVNCGLLCSGACRRALAQTISNARGLDIKLAPE